MARMLGPHMLDHKGGTNRAMDGIAVVKPPIDIRGSAVGNFDGEDDIVASRHCDFCRRLLDDDQGVVFCRVHGQPSNEAVEQRQCRLGLSLWHLNSPMHERL